MLVQPRLDREATTAAVAYLAARIRKPDYYMLGHLLYLADKRHLAEYGRSVTGERYHALPFGPVPSDTYAALQVVAGVEPGKRNPDRRLIELLRQTLEHVGGDDFRLAHVPDMGHLSESDVECLDAIVAEYGDADMTTVRDVTHDAAWEKIWARAKAQGRRSMAMPIDEIVETLPDAELLKEYLADPHPN